MIASKTLARDGRLVQWAYLFETERIPNHTSLCALFWRCVLLSPLKCLYLAGCAVAICVFIPGFIAYWVFTLVVLVPSLILPPLFVAAVVLLIAAHLRYRAGDEAVVDRIASLADSTLVQGALAIKRGICPMVEIR